MSILNDDIMSIDRATGRFEVTFHNVHAIKPILRLPGYNPAQFSFTFNAHYADEVADSIKSHLEKIPIMDLTDERIENVLRGHIAAQGRCWFFGPGHPRQLNREHDHHWELIYKATKYSKPCSIAVYPLYNKHGNP